MLDLSVINKKNICIMGLMGSGKSVIGNDLSKNLNLKFYDTDKEIELMTNKKISAIFNEEGESYFRDIEEKVCIEILTNDNDSTNIINVISKSANTEKIGDGKIFITNVDEVIRIRTGETGSDAI